MRNVIAAQGAHGAVARPAQSLPGLLSRREFAGLHSLEREFEKVLGHTGRASLPTKGRHGARLRSAAQLISIRIDGTRRAGLLDSVRRRCNARGVVG
jgi:hypothetical protein